MRSYPAFDKTIQIEFRAFSAFLWLKAGFEVRIGDRVFLPRLDRLTFFSPSLTEFDLDHQGKRVTGMVRGVGPWWFLVRQRYSLVVGLSELARDTQTMRGWPLTYFVLAVLLGVLGVTAFGALCLAAVCAEFL